MFLFFCAICFAMEPCIDWMTELSGITTNLKITEPQARQIIHGDTYDLRFLPCFKEAFEQHLNSTDITFKQSEHFLDAALYLLIAYVRKDLNRIPMQVIDHSNPLAAFYHELENRVKATIGKTVTHEK